MLHICNDIKVIINLIGDVGLGVFWGGFHFLLDMLLRFVIYIRVTASVLSVRSKAAMVGIYACPERPVLRGYLRS